MKIKTVRQAITSDLKGLVFRLTVSQPVFIYRRYYA
jgi:hypothetical protein